MYLIDGYNLLHALKNAYPGRFPRAFGPGRDRLLQLLGKFAASHNTSVIVFFDGNSGPVEPGDFALPGVAVRFCGAGDQTADRAICKAVEEHGEPAKLVVVTNDRQVATTSRHEGAIVESCGQFMGRLGSGTMSAQKGSGSTQSAVPDPFSPSRGGKKSRPHRRNKATPPEGKPSGGHIGDLERKMLDEIGDDWENLE